MGLEVGVALGDAVGDPVGDAVGDPVGEYVGDAVGAIIQGLFGVHGYSHAVDTSNAAYSTLLSL